MINHIKGYNTAGTSTVFFFFFPLVLWSETGSRPRRRIPETFLRINHAFLAASSLPLPGVPLTSLKILKGFFRGKNDFGCAVITMRQLQTLLFNSEMIGLLRAGIIIASPRDNKQLSEAKQGKQAMTVTWCFAVYRLQIRLSTSSIQHASNLDFKWSVPENGVLDSTGLAVMSEKCKQKTQNLSAKTDLG